jgi:Permease MlaE
MAHLACPLLRDPPLAQGDQDRIFLTGNHIEFRTAAGCGNPRPNVGASPSGAWTAVHAATLESLINFASPKVQQAPSLKIDMADLGELDTLGAWLLEKMSRRAVEAGHLADVVGVAGRYEGLTEDVRQVNRRKPARRPIQNPALGRLETVGRSTFSAVEDVSVFLQMLGALGSAGLGVLRRPRSLRVKSRLSPLSSRLAGNTDHSSGHPSDRRNHRPAGHLPLPQIRRRFLRRRPGRNPRAPRDWRPDRCHYGRWPVGKRLHRRAGCNENARRDGRSLRRRPVAWFYGGMSPAIFIARLHEAVSVTHFEVGMIKAPFMALVIGIVASSEGLREGKRGSVVKSIFLVIVLDGAFAVFFASIGM